MNIVACLASDTADEDKLIKYKAIGQVSKKFKQQIYWKLAYAYFASSTKLNDRCKHILFTNEKEQFVENGFNYHRKISELGVNIRFLPFSNYYIPVGKSNLYKNAYYKFEVFHELGKEKDASIYTDLDSVWINEWKNLPQLLRQYDILLYDVYARNETPLSKNPKDLSMKDMGDLFKRISKDYTLDFPIWYGGEFLAANPQIFKNLSIELKHIFHRVLKDRLYHLKFPNGESVLDGDEYLSSFVINNSSWRIYLANNHIKRIWTSFSLNTFNQNDFNLNIWHLPAEKISGFALLFNAVSKKNSKLKRINNKEIPEFYAHFFGVGQDRMCIKLLRFVYYILNKLKIKYGSRSK